MVSEGEGGVGAVTGMTWCTAFRRPYGTRFHHLRLSRRETPGYFEGPPDQTAAASRTATHFCSGFEV